HGQLDGVHSFAESEDKRAGRDWLQIGGRGAHGEPRVSREAANHVAGGDGGEAGILRTVKRAGEVCSRAEALIFCQQVAAGLKASSSTRANGHSYFGDFGFSSSETISARWRMILRPRWP